jgi:hypothetical protein
MGMSPPHYPTLDEPGIREEVVLTWKRLKARELAQARGEEIAKLIREAMSKPEDQRQEMAAAIESLTLLGDTDSAKLVSRQTLPFTWVRQQMTPAMNFQQQQSQLTMSEITFADGSGDQLEMAYDEFMNRIFNEMKNEDVGVVPVFDRSRFYVVQVVERSPTPEVGEEELRQRFLTEGRKFATSGSPIISMVRQAASGSVSMEWQKSLWQKYEIDPETLAESEAAMQ